MAGTVNIAFGKIDTPYAGTHGIVTVIIDWIADSADGSVPETEFDDRDTIDILGRYCILGITCPGIPAPTRNYDIKILDEYDCDIFGGNLKNRHHTKKQQTKPRVGDVYSRRPCGGMLVFQLLHNRIKSATGKCILYFEI